MTSPEDGVVICLKPADWPVQDQLAWATATREDDLLGEPGPLTHLRSITRLKLRGAYGRWLWHLTVTDPALLASPPAARITRDTVARYITELSARNASLTVAHRVLDLERAARAFAPAGDWRWLRKLVNKLFVRARPVRDKRARMRPPGEVFEPGWPSWCRLKPACSPAPRSRPWRSVTGCSWLFWPHARPASATWR